MYVVSLLMEACTKCNNKYIFGNNTVFRMFEIQRLLEVNSNRDFLFRDMFVLVMLNERLQEFLFDV